MKHLFNAAMSCKKKSIALLFLNRFKQTIMPPSYLILMVVFLFGSCRKQEIDTPGNETQSVSSEVSDMESLAVCNQTVRELKQAHEATAKYKDINTAIADGYVDINVVMPNMGYHYQKVSLVDSVFDISHPEILVYNKDHNGAFKLVAVEYAIPLDQSLNAPRGFTGKKDVWDPNTGFGLWLLHAWVWKYNPDGIFNPTNPSVHVQM